jgi:hypothetical protein
MNNDFQISDDFILPLFSDIFVVKERDFSIEYNPLGSGEQKLLMLVSSTSEEFLPTSELQLLQTIVDKGLKKQMKDVWVVNIDRFPNATLSNIWSHFQPQQVIVWGCSNWIQTQGVPADLHKQGYVEGAEMLIAAPLSLYLTDNKAKAKLWMAIQKMFFN